MRIKNKDLNEDIKINWKQEMLTIGYLKLKPFQRSSKRDGNIKMKNKFRERKREWN